MFRLSRQEFHDLHESLLQFIGEDVYKESIRKGCNSTPTSGAITLFTKLAITLRILAGAKYFDMHMYSVSMSYVGLVFNTTVDLIIDYMSISKYLAPAKMRRVMASLVNSVIAPLVGVELHPFLIDSL